MSVARLILSSATWQTRSRAWESYLDPIRTFETSVNEWYSIPRGALCTSNVWDDTSPTASIRDGEVQRYLQSTVSIKRGCGTPPSIAVSSFQVEWPCRGHIGGMSAHAGQHAGGWFGQPIPPIASGVLSLIPDIGPTRRALFHVYFSKLQALVDVYGYGIWE